MIKVNFTNTDTSSYHLPLGVLLWEGHNINFVFMPKVHNHNLIIRKYQENPSLGIFYKITYQCQSYENQRMTEEFLLIWRH